jgi:hypothetical protein
MPPPSVPLAEYNRILGQDKNLLEGAITDMGAGDAGIAIGRMRRSRKSFCPALDSEKGKGVRAEDDVKEEGGTCCS